MRGISEKIKVENYYKTKLPYYTRKGNPEGHARYVADESRLLKEFEQDLRVHGNLQIGFEMTDDQFKSVFEKAWSDGHAFGYHDVIHYFDELLNVIRAFVPGSRR